MPPISGLFLLAPVHQCLSTAHPAFPNPPRLPPAPLSLPPPPHLCRLAFNPLLANGLYSRARRIAPSPDRHAPGTEQGAGDAPLCSFFSQGYHSYLFESIHTYLNIEPGPYHMPLMLCLNAGAPWPQSVLPPSPPPSPSLSVVHLPSRLPSPFATSASTPLSPFHG